MNIKLATYNSKLKTQNSKLSKGFSILELLIVLVIIAIISAFSLSGYQSYIDKNTKIKVQHRLLEILQLQQQYYDINFNYATNINQLAIAETYENWQYAIEDCEVNIEGCYLITATNSEGDTKITINSLGQLTVDK